MKFTNLLADEAAQVEIGVRLAAARVGLRMTQAQLAEAAGVSKRTVERLEDGASTQLTNLLRCLRALGMLEALERLLPETPISPVELLKLRGRVRVRVRSPKSSMPMSAWKWGDED
jgi:transcriptional regulator with XRE-family HTH domain